MNIYVSLNKVAIDTLNNGGPTILGFCDYSPKKRTTRASPATTTTTTTPVTNAHLKALIDQGIADALATRNANGSQNGEHNNDSGMDLRRQAPLARECTYPDFMKCKPLYFKVKTVGHDVSYAITWTNLKKKMTDKYCPRGEIKKLEVKMWNLKVKGTDVDVVEFATELTDNKILPFAERQTKYKRKQDDNEQQENKRQNTGMDYTAGPGEKKPYGGSKPLCSKCKYHHDVSCTPKFHKCNRVVHLVRDCRSSAATNNQRNLTCYECGNQGHYRSDSLESNNQNHGNQVGGTRARRMAHTLGGGETNQDLNNMEDDINA
nr:hypothetical protein [Tanacetum cinerariifolium]